MQILLLALKSMANRRYTVAMTLLSISLSIMLLLGVERLRTEARESFANTISGTDLIVGARGGAVQLLLYSVFRIGNPTNNISWASYEAIRDHPLVAWTIPLSLGDSHRGYRVLGTNADYFVHYRFARDQKLELAEGRVFEDVHDAVLGAEVAAELGYRIDQRIIISHGTGEVSFVDHDDQPFRVVGILARTGTPIDRTVHVRLEGLEAIHQGWSGDPRAALQRGLARSAERSLQPQSISAALVGLESRLGVFRVQRFVNDYRQEPLLAALPGATLQELWDTLAIGQRALLAVSVLVVLVGITGMATAILTSLNERRREMAVLRSVGARPAHIFALFAGEALAVMTLAALLGLALVYLLQLALRPWIESQFGIFLPLNPPSPHELGLLGGALLAGLVAGLIPAYRAYRYSLADGMTIRL